MNHTIYHFFFGGIQLHANVGSFSQDFPKIKVYCLSWCNMFGVVVIVETKTFQILR